MKAFILRVSFLQPHSTETLGPPFVHKQCATLQPNKDFSDVVVLSMKVKEVGLPLFRIARLMIQGKLILTYIL